MSTIDVSSVQSALHYLLWRHSHQDATLGHPTSHGVHFLTTYFVPNPQHTRPNLDLFPQQTCVPLFLFGFYYFCFD